jgi:hypothetical protein
MQSLMRQLRDSFPEEPVPSRPITEHRCPDCDRVDELLGGQLWSDVAAGFPRECYDDFGLLKPNAQRYYLPAFMLSALGSNGMPIEALERLLTDGTLPPASFTTAQRGVVGRWVVECWGSWLGWEEPPLTLAEWWAEAVVAE